MIYLPQPVSRIRDKAQYYALHRAGHTGNTFPSYTYEEWQKQRHTWHASTLWSCRFTTTGSPHMRYDMTQEELRSYYQQMLKIYPAEQILVGPCAPDFTHCVFQCEVRRSPRYYDLWFVEYPESRGRMRMTLTTPYASHLDGLRAKLKLQHYMDAVSWDWLQEIFDTFPNSVVEFSTFSCPVGHLGWNTAFWEIRNY